MRLFSAHYQKEGIVKELTKVLYDNIKDYDEIILVNIGTDRVIGDSIAPLVGTMLTEKRFNLSVYGTIKEPMHALNLERRFNEIKVKHPNAFIIGIDACLGGQKDVGKIQVRDIPVSPGKGVGKMLQDIGDISIVAIVDESNSSELFTNRSIRLDFIYDMAKIISESFIKAEKKYIRYKKNTREIAVGEY